MNETKKFPTEAEYRVIQSKRELQFWDMVSNQKKIEYSSPYDHKVGKDDVIFAVGFGIVTATIIGCGMFIVGIL